MGPDTNNTSVQKLVWHDKPSIIEIPKCTLVFSPDETVLHRMNDIERGKAVEHCWKSLDIGKCLTLEIPNIGFIYVQINEAEGLNSIKLTKGVKRYKIQGAIPGKPHHKFNVEIEVDPFRPNEIKVKIEKKELAKVLSNSLKTQYFSRSQSQNP